MGITKLENQNLNDDVITSSKTSGVSVDSSKINAAVTNDDISPSANIATTKLDLSGIPSSQFVQMNGSGGTCLLYTSPSPRDRSISRMPSSA